MLLWEIPEIFLIILCHRKRSFVINVSILGRCKFIFMNQTWFSTDTSSPNNVCNITYIINKINNTPPHFKLIKVWLKCLLVIIEHDNLFIAFIFSKGSLRKTRDNSAWMFPMPWKAFWLNTFYKACRIKSRKDSAAWDDGSKTKSFNNFGLYVRVWF